MTMLATRALTRISGDDARGFLQGLVTQDMTAAMPLWSGLLTPQGKALHDFILWSDGADVLIDGEAAEQEALIRRLAMYRLRRAIVIAVEPALAVHWSLQEPVGGASLDPRLPELGYRWFAPSDDSTADEAWLAHRLSLGVTEGAAELGRGEILWLECNARELNGVSFTKGCYVGQENTARMHHRSKVNRRLIVAPLITEGDRTRATYPMLGLMVEHRRVETLGDALVPGWMEPALVS